MHTSPKASPKIFFSKNASPLPLRAPNRQRTAMHAQRESGNITDGVASWIEDNLNAGTVTNQQYMGGSNWSSCYVYQMSTGLSFFVKTSTGKSAAEMFEGEALGLKAMRSTRTLRIPEVFHYGDLSASSGASFIVMEDLKMRGGVDAGELGKQLALMHLAAPSDPQARAGKFGFSASNTIGGTSQLNEWSDNWIEFYREKRLRHQLKLANDSTFTRLGNTLCSGLEKFFDGVEVKPSVLHGDLWSGNIATVDGEPCVFDPATFYGHHEAEFGMSWCAKFSGAFWESYNGVIPRQRGWDDRHDLYTLYHYLNHHNMYGAGYYDECVQIMERLNKKL